ncbi:ThiF family adenylyltransferase [Corynebacterium uberis]|uniref:ThiF family adenylyltransferase n=1 Tax=Corynebacterium uberis TaxID=2883169 RepID=UPI001D0BB152|nr:ThiF family adenylyltransferase [Corynebacterium uberis]UDL74514.1 ThiF family adenylyltransferase [Corynebacterium uberis]UDL78864.1 ThiF family adenylyltransferase [Corynebacterium uberis]UDL83280.1 ThiF family adenylyltransferase [Corynebacterium uberis]UDL85488.1 ThiF family adenylyltransferase [Corynebacterium uberis]
MSRYLRQETLFGPANQDKLAAAHVVVLGAGGLGSPALAYLAAAGVGRLTIIDDDTVEISNLHRQVIHPTSAVGLLKADSAARTLAALNPEITVTAVARRLTPDNADELLRGADLVLDGTDNFATRHLASTACARAGIPHVWGSILGWQAQLSVFWADHGPVYEDLYPSPPPAGSVPSCAQAGVLGPVVGVVGSAMAMEALKLITGLGEPLIGRVAYYDSLQATWEHIPLVADPQVTHRTREGLPPGLTPQVEDIPAGIALIDVREPDEFARGAIPGARNVPLSRIEAATPTERAGLIAAPAVVYCQAGVRSERAVELLDTPGIVSYRGGFERWLAAANSSGVS